ncbi:sigma-70 family RNA polymerase sigma factor [Alicyclobacillus acidoterrestris]|uniref:RNA polymerase sigma factor SigS n=1 Tax=Alicyclobacillus acidoterrestris (strain ATCC 49025 / DSM 3922 / CIP 106132 / NCIMB 13137 / GD3B) TaxID=1356854 RepID=T0D205_ALIAG|nr:sigma-70 family RNA polymerase sigma factor [Alicyclobacillus acidoterrestris]EPZ45562.1 hypothetical protein N007_08955 [Alicyclobacillus acidoterrestris ATCC 49025]UNO49530.1 sigma-70 family RNA polymerase sigma factor [Alicyclobacillus acidoterrestris]
MDVETVSIEEAVMRAQLGEELMCLELLRRFHGLICSVARRYQGTCGFEEVYQEASLSFLVAIQLYNPGRGPFVAYAARKVRGDVRTAMRRLWRITDRRQDVHAFEGEVDADAFERAVMEGSGDRIRPRTTPQSAWITTEILRMMIEAAKLSERERAWLHGFIEGWTPEAMATAFHVSVETVRTWRKRALAKLRQSALTLGITFSDFV